ncbi:MAG: tetratricopeptide repeat protein [Planctomycetaceae bacterium]
MREASTSDQASQTAGHCSFVAGPFHPAPIVASLLQAGRIEWEAGDRDEARTIFAAAVAVDRSPLAHYLFAEFLVEVDDLTHALNHLHGGWENAKRIGSADWRATCCHAIADLHHLRGEGHLADRFRQRAITAEMDAAEVQLAELPPPTSWLCDRAVSAADWNDMPMAERWLTRAIRTISVDRPADSAVVLVNLGVVALHRGLWAKGLRHFQSAFRKFHEAEDLSGVARVVENIGHLLSTRCQYPKAATCFRRAMALFQQLGASDSAARCRRFLQEANRINHVQHGDPQWN